MANSSIKIRGLNAISNIVEDTTLQLGGDLDTNGHKINGLDTDGYLILRGDSGATDDFKLYDSGILDLPKQSGCRVYLNTTQTIPNTTTTKVEFDAEHYDTQNEFDPTTNHRFTATKAGKYLVTANLEYVNVTVDTRYHIEIHKNGSNVCSRIIQASVGQNLGVTLSAVIDLGANDYIEIYTYQTSGGNKDILAHSAATTASITKIQ